MKSLFSAMVTLISVIERILLDSLAVVQISAVSSGFDVAGAPNISPAEAREAPMAICDGVRCCPNLRRSSNSCCNKANKGFHTPFHKQILVQKHTSNSITFRTEQFSQNREKKKS